MRQRFWCKDVVVIILSVMCMAYPVGAALLSPKFCFGTLFEFKLGWPFRP